MRFLILPLVSILELIKRPIFWLLYPFAYVGRKWVRLHPFCNPLYWALDDSIIESNIKYGNPIKDFSHTTRSTFVEKRLPYDFCRAFYWSAWRNNSINLMLMTEKWIGVRGEEAYRKQWNAKSFYVLSRFSSGIILPYLEFWFGTFRLQLGFISCGRFQQQFRNRA